MIPKTVLILAATAVAALAVSSRSAKIAQKAPVRHLAKIAARPAPPAKAELAAALEQQSIQASFIGNGRDVLRVSITNKSAQALRVHVREGQIFESGNNLVVAVRGCDVDVNPGAKQVAEIVTAALASSNRNTDANYS